MAGLPSIVGARQALAEQPDRARVRHAVAEREPEEAHEGEPVVDEVLGPLVGQVVGRLDDQHLEHHHRIERRTAALRAIRVGQRRIERGPEQLEVHGSRERLKLVAEVAQPAQAVLDVKEPRLPTHAVTSADHGSRSRQTLQPRGFLEPSTFFRTLVLPDQVERGR